MRLALLEADVNLKVVKEFTARVRERCLKAEVLEHLSPAQQVVKVVYEELVGLLGERAPLTPAPHPPSVLMLVGLQGSGKTTTAAKLALHLRRQGQRSLLVPLDPRRPAAREQLMVLGRQINVPVLEDQAPLEALSNLALEKAGGLGVGWVIADTAGRLHIDQALMGELREIRDRLSPSEVLLVVDATTGPDGVRVVRFNDDTLLVGLGKVPLPPYIHAPLRDDERYQTVYADIPGSVAAPTAGLHFTPQVINEIKCKGVQCLFVTLHAGLDTFRPVRVADIKKHPIHQEYGLLSQPVADQLSQAKIEGRRIICVGTTTVRLVEAVAQMSDPFRMEAFEGWVSLFILPGYQFQVVNSLITNFHVPRSTLLMLVTAFAGKEIISQAYREAIARKYRFYSFGDAMLIL